MVLLLCQCTNFKLVKCTFPNRLPIFDVVNGVAKSVEDDVNQIIQPIFVWDLSGGSIQGTHSGNGHSVKYEVSLPSSSSQKVLMVHPPLIIRILIHPNWIFFR